ncbi:hypothetical protein D3C81_2321740 [compost metagenome]
MINLLLRIAFYHKGDRFVETEFMLMRTVRGGEPLLLEHKVREHNGSFLVRLQALGIAGKRSLPRVAKYR